MDGSIEALSDSLLNLSTEKIAVNIIHKSVGAISESDVLLASASNAIIVGFQVRPSASARKLAEVEETSGVRGSIFNNLKTVSTSSQTVVDTVKKVYEEEYEEPEQILTQLEMPRPVETTFTTSDPQVRFTGASDP